MAGNLWARFKTLATSSAVAAAPAASASRAEPPDADGPGGSTPATAGAAAPGTRTTTVTTTGAEGSAAGFPNWMLWLAMLLWALACVAGTFGNSLRSLPSDVSFSTADGQPVNFCYLINPAAVEEDLEVANQWCTPEEVIGRTLPSDVRSYQGEVQWDEIGWGDLAGIFGQPELWLTLGLGLTALMFLTGFAKATGTLRAGLAAAISVVFLGLLLFPVAFTYQLPADMRSELVEAWQWVIAFYFGSEAAVQAFKVWKPQAAAIGGDTATTPAAQTTSTTVTVSPGPQPPTAP